MEDPGLGALERHGALLLGRGRGKTTQEPPRTRARAVWGGGWHAPTVHQAPTAVNPWYRRPVELLGVLVLAASFGGLAAAVVNSHRRTVARKAAYATPAPVPMPPEPGPDPGPGPGPTPPTPGPGPDPESEFDELESDWKDQCWWDMKSPADAYMDLQRKYVTYWPADWSGEEPLKVWVDPPDLADVEPTAFWEGDQIIVEVVLRPKRRGWGTLMATEGQSGYEAVKGEVPWRAQCIKIEVV